ncbi:MAG: class I SAM-dependent methyltransferase [Candidatus Niyogibacteria bacterium]|nr:class I SAM-dependent methyltransferase [Candidatus Niyogibacteria bacterium]
MQKKVKQHYDKTAGKEWDRLFQDQYHNIEFFVTTQYLTNYLPKRGRILDAGGGPGRYTIHLARRDYKMTLLDISSEELKIAEKQIQKQKLEKQVDDIIEGTITDLSNFQDNYFDAVICLGGPLSHLVKLAEREKAVRELTRVAKIKAPIFFSVMSRYGVLPRVIKFVPQDASVLPKYFRDGNHPHPESGVFTYTHFFTIDELHNLIKKNNLSIIKTVAIEGIASNLKNEVNKMPKKLYRKWLAVFAKLSNESSIVGISEHFMVISKKI